MILIATLGPKASAVVDAARNALRPTDADSARIEAALRARLGASVLPLQIAVSRISQIRPSPRRFDWRFVPPAIGMFVIGGALSFALHPKPNPIAERKAAPQQVSAALVMAPALLASRSIEHTVATVEQPAAVPTQAASAHPVAALASSPTAPRRQDQLMLEVALLSRATTALNSGRAGDALKALNEHQREFPSGLLSEERRDAKAQALCLLGRVADGRAELAHLSSQPLAASRVKQICDAAATAADAK